MGIKFEYSHEFKETSIEKVREMIITWLNAEGAQKIKDDGATSIEAVHGTLKTFKPHERNGKKKLRFDLSPKGRSVVVNATATPSLAIADDIQRAQDETRINWGFLLEELWANIEGVAAIKSREKLMAEQKELEAKRAEASKKGPKVFIWLGLMEIGFWIAMILFLVYFLEIEFDTTMWALVAVLFLGSGAMITWGLLMMRSQKKAESYL